ncbi:MAG: DUF4189 domain-containing protein [Chakrabartia sp.]
MGFALFGFSAAPAFAQCGYGTSQQDCMHQQRDQEAARQAEHYYRGQQEQQQQQQQDFYQGPPPPRQNWVTSYMSVVYHPEANDVWAVWDRRTSQEEANQSALGLCSQMMGDGCKVASGGKGGTVAIARDHVGWMWWDWGNKPGDATRAVKASCSKNGGKCEIFKTVTATHWLEFENGRREDRAQSYVPNNTASLLNTYAMVAWPTAEGIKTMDAKWRGKTWLISGSKGYENTKKALTDKCKLDTRVDCVVSQEVNGGMIVQYQVGSGQGYWLVSKNPSQGAERVAEHCRIMETKCKILANFDAQTKRLVVIAEPVSTKVRTYSAVAWPQYDTPKWNNLAVVTGFPTLAGAKAKAIEHCAKESGVQCEIIGEVDQGQYDLLGLYIDGTKSVRYYQDWSRPNIEKMVKEDCGSHKTTCRELKIFDTNKLSVSTLSRGK